MHQMITLTEEEWIGANHQSTGPLSGQSREGRIEIGY
jgi:hypothetical protein